MIPPRTILVMTFVAAVAVFAVVQDRVTASGARQYQILQRAALAGRGVPVMVEQVMAPAVASSWRRGLASSGAVVAAGLVWSMASARGRRG